MKKIFTFLTAILLSASMAMQAQLLSAINDTPEGGTIPPEANLISGRNNAPQGLDYDATQDIITMWDNPCYVQSLASSTSPASNKINLNFRRDVGSAYFAGCIQFCVNYNNRNTTYACGAPAGHYTVGTSYNSTTNVSRCGGVSGTSVHPSYVDYYTGSSHIYSFLRSGTVDVQYLTGTNYCISVTAKNSNNKTIQFRVGTAPGNFSLDGYTTFSKTYTAVADFNMPEGRSNERCIKLWIHICTTMSAVLIMFQLTHTLLMIPTMLILCVHTMDQ